MPNSRLDDLPVRNGFRQRGINSTRIETFTDAAFAFALTLLVVSLEIPGSWDELVTALRGIPAFAASGALLMMFWFGHHEWSRRYGLDDGPTVILSCLLVFTVLVYVYPLKFMTQVFMRWISWVTGLPFSEGDIGIAALEVNSIFVVYGAGFVAMCGTLVLLNLHAWRQREKLRLDAIERFDTRTEIGAWTIVGGSGVVSIAVALVVPASWVGLPGWCYSLLAVVMPIYAARAKKRRRALERDLR